MTVKRYRSIETISIPERIINGKKETFSAFSPSVAGYVFMVLGPAWNGGPSHSRRDATFQGHRYVGYKAYMRIIHADVMAVYHTHHRPDKQVPIYYRRESGSSSGFRWEWRAFGSRVTRPMLFNPHSNPYSIDNAP
ncbi:hypothetical protein SAMN05216311_107364 [Chitinophaga sp. CF418]|nr:hypothetical protein SAMN05216311_107364 [Chitinophaga sp. CF418]